jgi:hypothetical protein
MGSANACRGAWIFLAAILLLPLVLALLPLLLIE